VYPTCAHASIGFGVVKKNRLEIWLGLRLSDSSSVDILSSFFLCIYLFHTIPGCWSAINAIGVFQLL
jgi:hypothetical protein